ncbi:MAG TPA: hypothetical protein VMN78_04345, partial [Longimicrobiales bacterium]|nr:hypothetical protein [Longimicrobiales bacterium]
MIIYTAPPEPAARRSWPLLPPVSASSNRVGFAAMADAPAVPPTVHLQEGIMKTAVLAVTAVLISACAEAPLDVVQIDGTASFAHGGDRAASITTIAVPGARATTAVGIGAGGDIVGTYTDANGVVRGFLLRDGEFTTIDHPGASLTQARGIGPNGEIVGSYRLPGEPGVASHGFLLTRDGEFVDANYPGHLYTIPQRILPDGTILGCRHNEDTRATMKGIAMGAGGNSETEAFASMHNGATPDLGLIVGLHTDMMTGRGEGYVIEDGVFSSFIVPGSTFTAAWDVNPAGEIVG